MQDDRDLDQAACSDCGALVSAGADRSFAFGSQGLLCWNCCVRRGGEYDAHQDRWTVEPRIADLPQEEP